MLESFGGALSLVLLREESIPKSKFCSVSLFQATLFFFFFLNVAEL